MTKKVKYLQRMYCIFGLFVSTAYSMRSSSKVVETVWIFEKDASRLFDDTPIYEGVILEYLHRVEVSHKITSAGITYTTRIYRVSQKPDHFSERELKFMFAICHRRSVCRLSSVTFVRPTQTIEIFGNVSTP